MSHPPARAGNRQAPLVARQDLDGAYCLLTFRHAEIAREARAGQFAMLKAGDSPEPPLRRPFSIMRADRTSGSFTIFLKAVGPGTRALAALSPGQDALCLGPLGRPFELPALGCEALLVAGGYGIAPFVQFCAELGAAGLAARVFYGGRSAGDLQLRRPFQEAGVPLHEATEDGSLGIRGRVTDLLERHLVERKGPARLYACGPEAMLHAVARIAARERLPAEVSLDPWMGCGLGTCLGCVVRIQGADDARPGYRCACTEGPVFRADAVVWPGDTASEARRARLEG
jgi:dihydroorotate dehydrogenase electron transfer subunit